MEHGGEPGVGSSPPARVVLAAPHRLVLESIAGMLERERDLAVVGTVSSGDDLVRLTRDADPDVVVASVSLPIVNGVDATRAIRRASPGVGVVCFANSPDRPAIRRALDAGAQGFVCGECGIDELGDAIRAVARGVAHLCDEATGAVSSEFVGDRYRGVEPAVLTPREREVLQLIAEGHPTAAIAERLVVSAKTVSTHRENVQRKLGITGTVGLAVYALREGLTSLDYLDVRPDERRE